MTDGDPEVALPVCPDCLEPLVFARCGSSVLVCPTCAGSYAHRAVDEADAP